MNARPSPPVPPAANPVDPARLPAAITAGTVFLTWEWELRRDKLGRDKWTKPPISARTGRKIDATDRGSGVPFADALAYAERHGKPGVGRMLFPEDGFVAIDVDHCRDPNTGRLSAEAARIARLLDSYTEASPSGTGVRILVRADLPPRGRRAGDIEMYNSARYVTLTGHRLDGFPSNVEDRQEALDALRKELFPVKAPTPAASPSPSLGLDDETILDRCRRTPKFRRLHDDGDFGAYPSRSEADLALCNFYAAHGATRDQADRLFRTSGLFRQKWDRRHHGDGRTYGEGTVDKAFDGTVVPFRPPVIASLCREPADGDDLANETFPADEMAALRAENVALRSTVDTLRARVAIADEQLAIIRNSRLGASRTVAAALVSLFRCQAPAKPERSAGYRVPLAKLADLTGLSEDAAGRQVATLATYSLPDGAPVLHRNVIDVPGGVDRDTGEIVTPHRELWIGPGVAPSAFGRALAALDPKERKPWGGPENRAGCPDHPEGGVVRRTRTVKQTRYECAVCRRPVGEGKVEATIGRERVETVPDPFPQDKVWPQDSNDRPAAALPNRQHAGTITPPHEGWESQSGKMQDGTLGPIFPPALYEDAGTSVAAAWQRGRSLTAFNPSSPALAERSPA